MKREGSIFRTFGLGLTFDIPKRWFHPKKVGPALAKDRKGHPPTQFVLLRRTGSAWRYYLIEGAGVKSLSLN